MLETIQANPIAALLIVVLIVAFRNGIILGSIALGGVVTVAGTFVVLAAMDLWNAIRRKHLRRYPLRKRKQRNRW